MRRSVVITVVLLCVAVVVVGGIVVFAGTTTETVAPPEADDPDLVVPEGSESGFWAYLNARPAFEERSPVNVIIRADPDEAVVLLTAETDADWDELPEEHGDAGPGTYSVGSVNETRLLNQSAAPGEPWVEAAGTTRYAYVDPGPDGDAQWVRERVQLEDGDYYGTRYHIRLYETPNPGDEWVMLQAHTEHFDWFTLRHRVDGVEAAQSHVEADLMAHPTIDPTEDIHRIYLGNDGSSDADGWATVIEPLFLLPLLGLLGITTASALARRLTETDRRRLRAARDRLTPAHLALVAVTAGIVLGVRAAGILLEHHAGFLSVHAIAAVLYPVLAVGLPTATYAIASRMERRLDAALAAATGLAVGFWVDYAYLGIAVLPIDVVVHRIAVILALGLIAAGSARRATRHTRLNDLLTAGLLLWTILLAGTLLGWF